MPSKRADARRAAALDARHAAALEYAHEEWAALPEAERERLQRLVERERGAQRESLTEVPAERRASGCSHPWSILVCVLVLYGFVVCIGTWHMWGLYELKELPAIRRGLRQCQIVSDLRWQNVNAENSGVSYKEEEMSEFDANCKELETKLRKQDDDNRIVLHCMEFHKLVRKEAIAFATHQTGFSMLCSVGCGTGFGLFSFLGWFTKLLGLCSWALAAAAAKLQQLAPN